MDTPKRYGHFDAQNREYVITDPRTPMPWMNYLFNDEYTALISATGGGYSFHTSAKDRRILRYRLNNLPMDRPGRYCYLRDNVDGHTWASNWAPVQRELEPGAFECRHGFGYTRIAHTYREIESLLTFAVPRSDNLEIWNLKLTNHRAEAADMKIFPYAEFCVWMAEHDLSNFQWSYNVVRCRGEGNVIHHETMTNRFGTYALFASSIEPASYECDREKFMGPTRGEANPQAVEAGRCSNSDCYHGNPIAAFEVPVRLEPGETREVSFVLGASVEQQPPQVNYEPYLESGAIGKVLSKLKGYWDEKLSAQVVETPDADVNLCLNQWHPYQTQVTFRQSRGPSIYEGGIRRGLGYRDSCQDMLGVTHVEHRLGKKRLTLLASRQLKEGFSVHNFFPTDPSWAPGTHRDTHLWLIMAVAMYLKETGDFDYLEEIVPFVDSGEATIYEHLKAAVDFSWNTRGDHGLCLLGQADWNDSLQCPCPDDPYNWAAKKSESVMISNMLVKVMGELIALAERMGQSCDADDFRERIATMTEIINREAWDGAWYRRSFKHDGEPLGSAENEYGKVWLNGQTWPVISGVAEGERATMALDAVKEHLDTDRGLAICWPAFQAFDPTIGGLSDFPAGLKENGGVFCHTNPWGIIASTIAGQGDRAWKYYRQLLPTEFDKRQELHGAEPYVYPQMIVGPEHPRFGLARNSWLTGAAAWMYVAATQYILGIRPEFDGLRIDPCIPAAWSKYTVTRRFRGATYHIAVRNPDHLSCGVTTLMMDGKALESNLLPVLEAGQSCKVEVLLGPSGRRA
jgi:N,N'-diacetylchitobiose phosphorylase